MGNVGRAREALPLKSRVHTKSGAAEAAALHNVANQQGNHQRIVDGPAVLFGGKAELGRLVFEAEGPAVIQIECQRQHQHKEGIVGRNHNGVGVEAVVGGGVQLRRKACRCPAQEAVPEVGERIPHGQRSGSRGGPHPEEHHADAPQHKHGGTLGP